MLVLNENQIESIATLIDRRLATVRDHLEALDDGDNDYTKGRGSYDVTGQVYKAFPNECSEVCGYVVHKTRYGRVERYLPILHGDDGSRIALYKLHAREEKTRFVADSVKAYGDSYACLEFDVDQGYRLRRMYLVTFDGIISDNEARVSRRRVLLDRHVLSTR